MDQIEESGWLRGVRILASPNFNQRPAGVSISLLVIHNISLPPGEFNNGCVEAFFCNKLDSHQHPYFTTIADLQVSAHFYIARDGQVAQFVSLYNRAWHAGRSSFAGVDNCNDYSIGVELEGADEIPYTDSQYAALVSLTKTLLRLFPAITQDRIVGHENVAPGRKTDPGPAFDWSRYLTSLA